MEDDSKRPSHISYKEYQKKVTKKKYDIILYTIIIY